MDPEPTASEENPAKETPQPEQIAPIEEQNSKPPQPPAPPDETPPLTETQPAEIQQETSPIPPPADEPAPMPQIEQAPVVPPPSTPNVETPPAQPSLKSFLQKALESIQFRKKAKLEKIMRLAYEKRSITNDQVQKLLRVSDATATRYLSALGRQGRLKRLGVWGSTRYEPIIGSIPNV